MSRSVIAAVVLLSVLTVSRPGSAAEPGTFIRVHARADVTGHTELAIHKAYSGQLGPVHDTITMPAPDPDGYPKVEVVSSGAIRVTRAQGAILVESTGPGLGEIDLFVTYNRLQSTWWLQQENTPGIGTVRVNAVVQFGEGLGAARQGNYITVRTPGGQEEALKDQNDSRGWSANETVETGSLILLNLAAEPDRVAPLWLTEAGLGLALLSLALSGYLLLRQRRTA